MFDFLSADTCHLVDWRVVRRGPRAPDRVPIMLPCHDIGAASAIPRCCRVGWLIDLLTYLLLNLLLSTCFYFSQLTFTFSQHTFYFSLNLLAPTYWPLAGPHHGQDDVRRCALQGRAGGGRRR
jgi:hypothetical protein